MASGFTFKTGKPKEEPTTFNVQITKSTPPPPPTPPLVEAQGLPYDSYYPTSDRFAFVEESLKDGKATLAVVQKTNGDYVLMDVTNKMNEVPLQTNGKLEEGLTPEQVALFDKYKKEVEAISYPMEGQENVQLSLDGMYEVANVSKGQGIDVTSLRTPVEKEPDWSEERQIPDQTMEITGHELPPQIQDDMTRTRRLRTAQGDIVLKREGEGQPWVIASGDYNPWRDYRPTLAKPERQTIGEALRNAAAARRMKAAEAAARRKNEADARRQEEAPKPAEEGADWEHTGPGTYAWMRARPTNVKLPKPPAGNMTNWDWQTGTRGPRTRDRTAPATPLEARLRQLRGLDWEHNDSSGPTPIGVNPPAEPPPPESPPSNEGAPEPPPEDNADQQQGKSAPALLRALRARRKKTVEPEQAEV